MNQDVLEGIMEAISAKNENKKVHFNKEKIEIVEFEESMTDDSVFPSSQNNYSEPPSSLFNTSILGKSTGVESISVNFKSESGHGASIDASLSEMITPSTPALQSVNSPKPSTRLLKFDWAETPRNSGKNNVDPFLDTQETVKPAKTFFIKSPFKPDFKPILSGANLNSTNVDSNSFHNDVENKQIRKETSIQNDNSEDDGTIGESNLSWLGEDDPLPMYENLQGGSIVEDNFFDLKKEMDEHISMNDDEFFGNNILEHEDSFELEELYQDSFHDKMDEHDGAVELSSINAAPSTIDHQTPHNNRTLQYTSDDLFSPGSFFASRSGQLGDLEAKDERNRPTWYTPKHDSSGRLIDPIGKTPADRPEKNSDNQVIRKPLYVPTPSAFTRQLKLNDGPIKNVLDDQIQDSAQVNEAFPDPLLVEHQTGKENLDPFDWQQAMEQTIPDTTVEEPIKLMEELSLSSSNAILERFSAPKLTVSLPGRQTVHLAVATTNKPKQLLLEICNDSANSITWTMKPVGSCSFQKESSSETQATWDKIFHTESSKGCISYTTSDTIIFQFSPIQKGIYTILYHLQTNFGLICIWIKGESNTALLNNNVDLERSLLSAEQLQPPALPSNSRSGINGDDIMPFHPSDQTPKSKSSKMKPVLLEYSTPQTVKSAKTDFLLLQQSTGKKLATPKITRHVLDFGSVQIGKSKTLHLRVCNPDQTKATVSFVTTGHFKVPIHELEMPPRSFFILPICFSPILDKTTTKGALMDIDERLIVKKSNKSNIPIRLGLKAVIMV